MIGNHPEQLDRPVCDRERKERERRERGRREEEEGKNRKKQIKFSKIPLASSSYMHM